MLPLLGGWQTAADAASFLRWWQTAAFAASFLGGWQTAAWAASFMVDGKQQHVLPLSSL